MSYEIQSEKHLRVSRSGMSLKTGWSDDKRIVAVCPVPIEKIGKDEKATKAYEQWLEDAEKICQLWNGDLLQIELPESLKDPMKVLERGQTILDAADQIERLRGLLARRRGVPGEDCGYDEGYNDALQEIETEFFPRATLSEAP